MRSPALKALDDALPAIRQEFPIASLAIFGSAARDELGPASDIDLLVSFDPTATVTLFTLARLKQRLEDVLGRSVDLVEDHPRLQPEFRARIERELIRVA